MLFSLLVLIVMPISAQLPKTDVYLLNFDYKLEEFHVNSLKLLSHFNADGYNNQAQFFGTNDVYLAVGKSGNTTTDIYRLNLKKESFSSVTETPKISEFSPTPCLDEDHFTVVRIEADGVDQSLWMYPIDQSNLGKRILPKLDKVGYHCWLSNEKVALFLVGKPHQLFESNVVTGTQEWIANNIGRCLKKRDGELFYIEKIRLDYWILKTYDINTKLIKSKCQMPIGVEDFDFLEKDLIIAADKDKLKCFNLNNSKGWYEIADFSSLQINKMNRLAVNKNKLLFINNK